MGVQIPHSHQYRTLTEYPAYSRQCPVYVYSLCCRAHWVIHCEHVDNAEVFGNGSKSVKQRTNSFKQHFPARFSRGKCSAGGQNEPKETLGQETFPAYMARGYRSASRRNCCAFKAESHRTYRKRQRSHARRRASRSQQNQFFGNRSQPRRTVGIYRDRHHSACGSADKDICNSEI